MTFNVMAAQIKHETNTFSRLTTGLDAFRGRTLLFGDDVVALLKGTSTEMGGFIRAAEERNWTLRAPVAADATPGGKVTGECWRRLVGAVIDEIDDGGQIDGVLFSLHGAMVTEEFDDAEGELLRLIRAKVGEAVPVIATLDMHANVTALMAAQANALIAYRTYPHIDHVDRALQAGDLLERAMRREIRPSVVLSRAPLLIGADHGRTHADPCCAGPMDEMLAAAKRHENEEGNGILAVSVQAGFGWADIVETGPTVAVVSDGDRSCATAAARALMLQFYGYRGSESVSAPSPAQAMARVMCLEEGPVVLADYTDNPGGGGYGDATRMLRAMIDAKLDNSCLHAINDPEAVACGLRSGIGAEITIELGGKVDPAYGAPITVTGTVRNLTDGTFTCDGPMYRGVRLSHGPTMVLRIGGIDVVVSSHRLQTTDLQAFLSQGIDPATRRVVAVKSWHHFRAAYAPIAREVVLVNSGGLCDFDFSRFPFRKVRRPIWPLDDPGPPDASARLVECVASGGGWC